MVQVIMDCMVYGILPTTSKCYQLDKLESAWRRYCYALHWLGKRLTDEKWFVAATYAFIWAPENLLC